MNDRFIFSLAVIVAIASSVGILWAFLSAPTVTQTATAQTTQDNTVTSMVNRRTFYLFNAELEQVDETKTGVAGDIYSLQTMIVKKGDRIDIKFFNTEPDKDERHSFTLPAYQINKKLDGGDHADIGFVANKAGFFEYYCIFHQPEMRGQFIVEP
jgi:plastocyanin